MMLFKQNDETLRGIVKDIAILAAIVVVGAILLLAWLGWGLFY